MAQSYGLFGATRRRLPNVDTTGMGLLSSNGASQGSLTGQQMPTPPPPQKRGFFAQGGPGRAIAGTIGDVLLQRGGLAPIYGPQMELMQQVQAEEESRQQQRQDRRDDMQWEWQNKPQTPHINDTVADYEFIRQQLGDEQAQAYLRNRADPPQYRQGPDGQFYRVATSEAPASPVGRLTPIDGGPGGSPSGAGFR